MPVPTFQEIMLPLLRLCADERPHRFPEVREELAEKFGLTPAERGERLKSGATRFGNRVRWARLHLVKAQLLEAPTRGVFQITARGRAFLETEPKAIRLVNLKQFPEYAQWRGRDASDEPIDDGAGAETPQEVVDHQYRALRRQLEQTLLQRVKAASPEFFEQLVVTLLVKMGYGGSHEEAASAVGQAGDGGIDGVINEDILGLDTVYLQAKRWDHTVGRPVVQAFAGALEGRRAQKGVLLTTSSFSSDARRYVEQIQKRIVLVDGQELARLMVDHRVGVHVTETYMLYDVDEDFFGDEVVPEAAGE